MSATQEVELKLEATAKSLQKIERMAFLHRAKPEVKVQQLTSVYFDTKKCTLKKNGISLRVRSAEGKHVQTIKADPRQAQAVGLFERREWETELSDDRPNFVAASGTALEPLVSKKLLRRLKPVFETRIERRVFPVGRGNATIEVSLDRGEVRAGDVSSRIAEIEFELKHGDSSELFQVAEAITKTEPVRLSLRSKAERGYELIEGSQPQPAEASVIALNPDWTSAHAFRTIALSCLRQIAANERAVREGNPEGIHQMRIGLRRLRATISLFSEMLLDRQTKRIKQELKWLTDELGPARQLHVFAGRVVGRLRRGHAHEKAMRGLSADVSKRQTEALSRAVAAVDSDRFRRLLLDVVAWIEAGEWLSAEDPLEKGRRERSIRDFAPEELTRRRSKIIRKGKQLPELNTGARHKLRIAAKKLRYASEFFATLFPDPGSRKLKKGFLAGLKVLQDCLGELNDIAAHERLSYGMAERARPRSAVAFLAGVGSGYEESRSDVVLKSSLRAYGSFAKARGFWH